MKGIALEIMTTIVIIFAIVSALYMPTFDWSSTDAIVKVQEVGTRYYMFNLGEQQHYIRIQNAFSDQFSSSSEAWETCINENQFNLFKQYKDNRTTINIHVEGYGLSSAWKCTTGDHVTSVTKAKSD